MIWIPVICMTCHEANEREVANRLSRDRHEDWQRRLGASGLPTAYRTGLRTFRDIPGHEFEEIAAAMGGELRGLYIHGKPGTFKTSVAAAFLKGSIDAGGSGRYVFLPDLMDKIYASYNGSDDASVASIVADLSAVPMLVLDDLGKEKRSEHSAGILFRILDGRYRQRSPNRWLIVTSNDSIAKLTRDYAVSSGEDNAKALERRIVELTVPVQMSKP